MRIRDIALILLVPSMLIVLILFGTNYLMDYDIDFIDYSQLFVQNSKELVLSEETAVAVDEGTQTIQPPSQPANNSSDGTLGGHPIEWFLLCSVFESFGNPACSQRHYACGYLHDCSGEWSVFARAPEKNYSDAIGMFQFDYQYWGTDDNIMTRLIAAYPDDFSQFAEVAKNPKLSQDSQIALDIHKKLCEVRDRDWKGLADVQAQLCYDRYTSVAIKCLDKLTNGAVNESNLTPALGAVLTSLEIRLGYRLAVSSQKSDKLLPDLHAKIIAANGDQRAIINHIYDYLTLKKSDGKSRYDKERVIALDMYDNPDFDPYASRTKDNEVTDWNYGIVGFGHCLGMEGYN